MAFSESKNETRSSVHITVEATKSEVIYNILNNNNSDCSSVLQ